jgi:hypothetical protein
MEAMMSPADKEMFYRHLNVATNYLEYGSGGSTYQAALRPNLRAIYSVESDLSWHTSLKSKITNPVVTYLYANMETSPDTFGYPGEASTRAQWINYASQITQIPNPKDIDLVLIDGRFRVASCLHCFNAISDTCLIAFDDFVDRPQYHPVLSFFDVVKKTTDNRMVILKKKTGIAAAVPQEVIATYETQQD